MRPDWRGRGVSWALTRLSYLLAIEKWGIDWFVALVLSGVVGANIPQGNYGFSSLQLLADDFRLLGFSEQRLFITSMSVQEALALIASEIDFMAARPYLAINERFGDELRLQRRHQMPSTQPPLKIAI